MKILVTGGAGYIGSFMTRRLLDEGYEVTVLDSLERGHKEAVDNRAKLVVGDLLDSIFLKEVFSNEQYDGVIHFAGLISVGESMQSPTHYFSSNVQGSVNLLDAMVQGKCQSIIFSSSAAVYGNPKRVPIDEDHPKHPESVYGETKWMVEKILQWYFITKQINSVSLRYFNAAGASLDGTHGEMHNPETHIIPKIIEAVMMDSEFTLFGTDYDTSDGTCIRDYIHVLDLTEAHVLSIHKLQESEGNFSLNIGTGWGHSNKEVVAMVEKVSGKKVKIIEAQRREGDPAKLIADAAKIKEELHFTPKYSDLETIVTSAWKWHTNHLGMKNEE